MSKSKHTPGPWRVKYSTGFVDGEIKEYCWVGVGPIGDETPILANRSENEANARLIAVAPELLKIVKLMANELEIQYSEANAEESYFEKERRRLIKLSHNIINKAEGNE